MTMLHITIAFTILYSISKLTLVNSLQCSICADFILSFNDALKLPSKCQEIPVEAVGCQTIFHMNYLTKEIYLNLTIGSDPNRNYTLDLSAENKFDEPKRMTANMTYTCKTSNDCAKLFYQSTIQSLIQNEPILNELRAELFDPMAVSVQQCSNNQDQPITCQNGYGCHGYEFIQNDKANFEGECRNASTVTIFPRLYFSITLVQGDVPLSSDWNHLGFTCNKRNLCNTRQQIRTAVKLANEFYPWEFTEVNSSVKVLAIYHYLLVCFVISVVHILYN